MNRFVLLFITILICIVLSVIIFLSECQRLIGDISFNPYQIFIHLTGEIHNDRDISLQLIRFVHNKPRAFLFEFFSQIFTVWDIWTLTLFLSPVGFIGLISLLFFHPRSIGGFLFLSSSFFLLSPKANSWSLKLLLFLFILFFSACLGIGILLRKKPINHILTFLSILTVISAIWIMGNTSRVFPYC